MLQLTLQAEVLIDHELRSKVSPTAALRTVTVARKNRGNQEALKQTVYRYINGQTHRRGRAEKRGRKRALTKADVRKITQTRRRLIKEATGEYRVTYGHAREVSGLKKKACQKVMEEALRAKGV